MAKKFLTLNIGASAIALAEYEQGPSGLTLANYGTAALAAPLDVGNADTVLSPAVLEIVREKGIKPGRVAVSLSGQMVFPRIAAIPFVGSDEAKFEQLVRYEIEQNVPFPIDEMICDRQILGETENGDKSVLIVAAKTEQVESVTNALIATGFEPEIVDVAPLALTNALKANRPDEDGCRVILDIGAKTTSLVIVEGEKLYNRSIPVAGNTVTKEIAQALGCTLEEAEGVKRENAYVSMGGVTEDEDETLDRISKVCRAVMTRLHAEISRSINFYRSQQGGGMPGKLYLTGGSALLPQIDQFFRDSLQIEVEYLNSFETIAVAPAIDATALEADAAFLSATAGLALHAAGRAELAINLLPQSILDARAEVARIPFVAVGAFGIVAALVCLLIAVGHGSDVISAQFDAVNAQASSLRGYEERIKRADAEAVEAAGAADRLRDLLVRRGAAVTRLNAVRQAIGDELWIDKWVGNRITVRGWKERVKTFVEKAAAKAGGETKTASEIVASRLKANPAVVADSVKIVESSYLGKENCVEQFVVEITFK